MTKTSQKALVAAVFSMLYAAVGIVRHWHFDTNAFDLGIFDQVVWHLSRFELPGSTVHGYANILGDHFSPLLVLFAPFYWIHAAPETLIAAQGLFFGASIVPVWIFLERRLPARAALLMALAYGCFWGLQRAALFDVHEFAFAPLLIAVMLLGADGESVRWPVFAAGAVPLLFVKEDMIPIVAATAMLLAIRRKGLRARIRAAAIAILAVAFFALVVVWIIPSFNPSGGYATSGAFADTLDHPSRLLVNLVSPPAKLQTALLWLLPFLFLPLASPYGLLLVPLALERFLSAISSHWSTSFHYSAPVAPILAMAAGDGLARLLAYLDRRLGPHITSRMATGLAAACLVLSSVLPGRQPLWKPLSASFYRTPPFAETARRALATIPAGASVVAQGALVPHLSERQHIYTLRPSGTNADIDADYVIAAATDLMSYPSPDERTVQDEIEMYRQRGYRTVFDERGWVVLARAGTR